MYKKRALVLWGYLSLLALAACWPKVVDDADLVSIDYVYTFSGWSIVEQWSKDIVIWEAGDLEWMESIIRWAKQDEEFQWKIDWGKLYEHDRDKVLSFQKVHMTEIFQIENPVVWTEVHVDDFWDWVIKSIEKDDEGYDVYVVEFNDPKTYSELFYSIKITNIEKR